MAIASEATGALAAEAAVTLIREDLASAAPMAFLSVLAGALEAGRAVSAENTEIAREEVGRLQKLIASHRATPGIRLVAGAVRLATAVCAACRDLELAAPRESAEVLIDVPDAIVVSVDATALGWVIYSVIKMRAARGAARVRLAAASPAAGSPTATLSFAPDVTTPLDGSVFAPRAWAGSDIDAITFAIARRAARASSMLLRPPRDRDSTVHLKIPLDLSEN